MKKIVGFLVAVLSAAIVVPKASAGVIFNGESVQVTAGSPRDSGFNGGPFNLTPTADASRSVVSFCLEYEEHISLNQTYWATVDAGAIYGGPKTDPGSLTLDPISEGTAQLFLDWLNQSVQGVSGPYDQLVSEAVQKAIWRLEGEISSTAGLANDIYGQYKGLSSDYTGNAVKVVNLWSSQGAAYTWDGRKQSQLVSMVPEPASVVLWGLVTTTLGGGLYLRRRRARVVSHGVMEARSRETGRHAVSPCVHFR